MNEISEQELENIQIQLAKNVVTSGKIDDPRFVAGLDVTFQGSVCIATLVVLHFPSLRMFTKDCEICEHSGPAYQSGFLAFQQLPVMKLLVERNVKADVYFVAGNGILHPRKLGIASHLGVLCDIPVIGVCQSLSKIDGLDIRMFDNNSDQTIDLKGESGFVWGKAIRTGKTKFIFVSVGHKINLESATSLVLRCSKYKSPEPIRIAKISGQNEFKGREK